MHKIKGFYLGAIAVVLLLVGLGFARAAGSDEDAVLFDRSIARVHSGSSFIDVSAGVYTAYLPLVTIEPTTGAALRDVKVVLDLDGGDDADGFAGGYTSETIRFAVGRKIQGKWRIDNEAQTATISGTNSGNRSVTLDLGIVSPTEDARIYVLVSAEQTDVEIPYVVLYQGPERATFTDVTN
jgi:hypothetical protein